MIGIVEDAIRKYVDEDKMNAVKDREQELLTSLREYAETL